MTTRWTMLVMLVGCGSQTVNGSRAGGGSDAASEGVTAADVAQDRPTQPMGDASGLDAADVLPRAPQGNTCDDAIPLPYGGEVTIAPPRPTPTPQARPTCENLVQGVPPVRWARVTIPPRARVELVGDLRPTYYPYFIHALTRCSIDHCVARSELELNDRVHRLPWSNPTDAPLTLYVALTTSTIPADMVPLRAVALGIAPNGYCADATRVSDGATVVGQDLLRAGERVGRCNVPPAQGIVSHALFYRVNVPAGHTLFATARSPAERPWDLMTRLSLRERCVDGVCLASGESGVGAEARAGLAWSNDGATRDVVVALEEHPIANRAEARVSFRVVPAATHTSCDAARPLAPGEPQEANLASGAFSPLSCLAFGARALFYTARVPAASTLQVSAEAIEGVGDDFGVQVYDSCVNPQCLSRPGAPVEQRATFVNTGPARTVVVALVSPGVNRGRLLARVTARVTPN